MRRGIEFQKARSYSRSWLRHAFTDSAVALTWKALLHGLGRLPGFPSASCYFSFSLPKIAMHRFSVLGLLAFTGMQVFSGLLWAVRGYSRLETNGESMEFLCRQRHSLQSLVLWRRLNIQPIVLAPSSTCVFTAQNQPFWMVVVISKGLSAPLPMTLVVHWPSGQTFFRVRNQILASKCWAKKPSSATWRDEHHDDISIQICWLFFRPFSYSWKDRASAAVTAVIHYSSWANGDAFCFMHFDMKWLTHPSAEDLWVCSTENFERRPARCLNHDNLNAQLPTQASLACFLSGGHRKHQHEHLGHHRTS